MTKFHVNGKGVTSACRATTGVCPFGGEHQHYPTAEAARTAYELSMAGQTVAPKTKKKVAVNPTRPFVGAQLTVHGNASAWDASYGFYEGMKGEIVEVRGSSYLVQLDNGEQLVLPHQLVKLAD